MTAFTESVVEQAALAWLDSIGWRVAHGPDAAPGMSDAERAEYGSADDVSSKEQGYNFFGDT